MNIDVQLRTDAITRVRLETAEASIFRIDVLEAKVGNYMLCIKQGEKEILRLMFGIHSYGGNLCWPVNCPLLKGDEIELNFLYVSGERAVCLLRLWYF